MSWGSSPHNARRGKRREVAGLADIDLRVQLRRSPVTAWRRARGEALHAPTTKLTPWPTAQHCLARHVGVDPGLAEDTHVDVADRLAFESAWERTIRNYTERIADL